MRKPTAARAAEVFSLRALQAAALRSARGKRHRASVARFLLELEPRLVALRDALQSGTWQPSTGTEMNVRDPKPRVISVPSFADRVVHQALAQVLGPRLDRRLITDTYASRIGRGTHAAMRRARSWARTYRFAVHLDAVQYFPSIDHRLLLDQLGRDTPEPFLRALCARIVGASLRGRTLHFPGDDLFSPLAHRVGLPLGSFTSQLFANRYLDPVDHLAKDRLRVRPYLRYMDDLLLFGDDARELAATARTLEQACWELRLRMHPWEVRPTRAGVGFVGYRVVNGHVRVRRSTVARAERGLARIVAQAERGEREPHEVWDALRSTFAHWDHADTWRLKGRLLARLHLLWPSP